MNIVIFGLGSMGKRRARCIQAIGDHTLYGFDLREDRIDEAQKLGISASSSLTDLPLAQSDAFLICTPPLHHARYLQLALEFQKPTFVEASVLLDDLKEIDFEAKRKQVLIAPSCTLCFHPAVTQIKQWVESGIYGKVSNFSYHCGQYLPDWHPWEKVSDFYVSNPLTGGAREIVPFELTWLVSLLGQPTEVKALYGKTVNVGADITDTYAISLGFKDIFGTMLIDVSARYGLRSLILNFENAQVQWRWDENKLHVYEAKTQTWQEIILANGTAAKGYNPNIHESMYQNELLAFFEAAWQQKSFPNSLEKDIVILQLLKKIEKGGAHENL